MDLEKRIAEVEEKLAKAERRYRFLLIGIVIALAIGFVGFVRGHDIAQAGSQKSITAESFVLIDRNGDYRGSLGMSDNGVGPDLILRGEKGEGLIMLRINEGFPELNICDKKNNVRARLGLGTNGPKLMLYDENRNCRVGIGVVENQGPALILSDSKERNRIELSSLGDNSTLRMLDAKGNSRVFLYVKEGSGAIICNGKGEPIWAAP